MTLSLALTIGVRAAESAETFAMPQGCEAYVTIQKRSCIVSHQFRCEADPEGHQRRVDLNESGMVYMGVIDAETQWIESFYPDRGEVSRLMPDPADPASLTELLQTGRDGMDFQTMSDLSGLLTFRGSDWLTGETVEIDGVTLEVTRFEMEVLDPFGNLLWSATGSEFIHREWRTFIAGTRTYTTADGSWDTDNRPVQFIFPGQPGFLSSRPRHDCGFMMSGSDFLIPEVPS
ncbi:MAG: hypothetical protein JJT81_08600 [Rubellimicrobium sp.]|nr:hypothetical protein [Rubellimicrobium sp.]